MSTNPLHNVPVIPPPLPNTPPPLPSSPPPLPSSPPPTMSASSSTSTLQDSPTPTPPEKPPRVFPDTFVSGESSSPEPSVSPSSFQTTLDTLQIPSDSFQTPPDSLQPSPSDTSRNLSSSSSKNAPADTPAGSVAATDDVSTADEIFVDAEDQGTGLLRKPSLRRRATPQGDSPQVTGDSKFKRAMSDKIDRLGSVLSRILDRDKSTVFGDRAKTKSVGSLETNHVWRTDGIADNKLVPYGSNFLRRSFRMKTYEFDDEDLQAPPTPDTVYSRRSVYNEDLVSTLVCAACARYMVAPIEQCKRGHNICKFCRRRAHQHRCPKCNKRLTGIRNYVAEEMARKLLFPCVHAHAGCMRQVPNDELEFHEPRCPFRVYQCLISVSSGVPCKWQGRREGIEQHVRKEHSRYFSAQETTKWRWTPNLILKMEDFQLISAFGELFWYCAAQEPERLRVCWFVQHIGYDQDSVRFEYRIVFNTDEKDRRLEMTCTTLPDYSSVNSIVESGHCLDMSYQQALSFVDEEGTIKFSVTIIKLD